MDNSADIVPNDLDLLNVWVGYDESNLRVRYTVQGAISGGARSPTPAHAAR